MIRSSIGRLSITTHTYLSLRPLTQPLVKCNNINKEKSSFAIQSLSPCCSTLCKGINDNDKRYFITSSQPRLFFGFFSKKKVETDNRSYRQLVDCAVDNIKNVNYDVAMKELERAQSLSSDVPDAYLLQADILQHIYHNYKGAIKLYDHCLKLDNVKQNKQLYSSITNSMIECYSYLSDPVNAFKWISALDTKDLNASALYQLFKSCLIKNSMNDVVRLLDLIKDVDYNTYLLASGDAKQNDVKGAIQYYNQVYENEKEELKKSKHVDKDIYITDRDGCYRFIVSKRKEILFNAMIGLARCYIGTNEPAKAYQLYKEASTLNFDAVFTFSKMAEIMVHLKNYKQALLDINQSLLANPKKQSTNLLKAEILYHLGEYKQCADIICPILLYSFQTDLPPTEIAPRTRYIEIAIESLLHIIQQTPSNVNDKLAITLDEKNERVLDTQAKDLQQLSNQAIVLQTALIKQIKQMKNDAQLTSLVQMRLSCMTFITRGIMETSILHSTGKKPLFTNPDLLFTSIKKLACILLNK
ncbi:hypothetical protein CYY_009260 [Polysphondylium violaceum]|uniref:Tetratricopeptide-like helical domain-containing protein n=1 Tax=Polysphondylium violaceum TaxID=133409 RepID=A0A8J4PM61_9MYCE|nr:hypothetical protein CYY_009260 [Polysphondylium violaceum]